MSQLLSDIQQTRQRLLDRINPGKKRPEPRQQQQPVGPTPGGQSPAPGLLDKANQAWNYLRELNTVAHGEQVSGPELKRRALQRSIDEAAAAGERMRQAEADQKAVDPKAARQAELDRMTWWNTIMRRIGEGAAAIESPDAAVRSDDFAPERDRLKTDQAEAQAELADRENRAILENSPGGQEWARQQRIQQRASELAAARAGNPVEFMNPNRIGPGITSADTQMAQQAIDQQIAAENAIREQARQQFLGKNYGDSNAAARETLNSLQQSGGNLVSGAARLLGAGDLSNQLQAAMEGQQAGNVQSRQKDWSPTASALYGDVANTAIPIAASSGLGVGLKGISALYGTQALDRGFYEADLHGLKGRQRMQYAGMNAAVEGGMELAFGKFLPTAEARALSGAVSKTYMKNLLPQIIKNSAKTIPSEVFQEMSQNTAQAALRAHNIDPSAVAMDQLLPELGRAALVAGIISGGVETVQGVSNVDRFLQNPSQKNYSKLPGRWKGYKRELTADERQNLALDILKKREESGYVAPQQPATATDNPSAGTAVAPMQPPPSDAASTETPSVQEQPPVAAPAPPSAEELMNFLSGISTPVSTGISTAAQPAPAMPTEEQLLAAIPQPALQPVAAPVQAAPQSEEPVAPQPTPNQDTTGLAGIGAGIASGMKDGLINSVWQRVQDGKSANIAGGPPPVFEQAVDLAASHGLIKSRGDVALIYDAGGNKSESAKALDFLAKKYGFQPQSAPQAGQPAAAATQPQAPPEGNPKKATPQETGSMPGGSLDQGTQPADVALSSPAPAGKPQMTPEQLQLWGSFETNHGDAMRAFVAKKVANQGHLRSSVDDIVQDTLQKAATRYGSFDKSKPIGAWLKGIANNTIKEYSNKTPKVATAEATDQPQQYADTQPDMFKQGDRVNVDIKGVQHTGTVIGVNNDGNVDVKLERQKGSLKKAVHQTFKGSELSVIQPEPTELPPNVKKSLPRLEQIAQLLVDGKRSEASSESVLLATEMSYGHADNAAAAKWISDRYNKLKGKPNAEQTTPRAAEATSTPEASASTSKPEPKSEAEPRNTDAVRPTEPTRTTLDPVQSALSRDVATPVLDLKKNPTGWLVTDGQDAISLIHPTEDYALNFPITNKKSGSEALRRKTEAHAYAIDNPVDPKATSGPEGKIVTRNIAESKQSKRPEPQPKETESEVATGEDQGSRKTDRRSDSPFETSPEIAKLERKDSEPLDRDEAAAAAEVASKLTRAHEQVSESGDTQLEREIVSLERAAAAEVNGTETTIKAPGMNDVPARFALVDLKDVIASHDFSTGEMSSTSNAKKGLYPESLQPRDYDVGSDNHQKVVRNAKDFDARELLADSAYATSGSPVVTPDMIVLNGNGRTMTLQLARHQGKGEHYQDALRKTLPLFGFTDADMVGMDFPTLVRVVEMDATSAEAKKFAEVGNISTTQAQSPAETARKLGSLLPEDIVNKLHLEGDETFSEAINKKKFRDAVRQAWPSTERATYFNDDGSFTAAGRDIVLNTLLQKIAPLSTLKELTPAQENLIASSIPQILTLKTQFPELDITPQLIEAMQFRNKHNPQSMAHVTEALATVDLFTKRRETLSPGAKALMPWLFEMQNKPTALREVNKKLLGMVDKKDGASLFTEETDTSTPAEKVQAATQAKMPEDTTFGEERKPGAFDASKKAIQDVIDTANKLGKQSRDKLGSGLPIDMEMINNVNKLIVQSVTAGKVVFTDFVNYLRSQIPSNLIPTIESHVRQGWDGIRKAYPHIGMDESKPFSDVEEPQPEKPTESATAEPTAPQSQKKKKKKRPQPADKSPPPQAPGVPTSKDGKPLSSIARADMNAERETMGAEGRLDKPEAKLLTEMIERAENRMKADSELAPDMINAILSGDRRFDDEDQMVIHVYKTQMGKQLKEAADAIAHARSPEAKIEADRQHAEAEARFFAAQEAANLIGATTGRALALRRFGLADDLSYEMLLSMATGWKGDSLSDTEKKKLHDISNKAEAINKDIAETADNDAKQAADEVVAKEVKQKEKRSKVGTAKKAVQDKIDAAFAKLGKLKGKVFSIGGAASEGAEIFLDLVRAYAEAGVLNFKDLMSQVSKRVGEEQAAELEGEFHQAWNEITSTEGLAGGIREKIDPADLKSLADVAKQLMRFFVEGGMTKRAEIEEAILNELKEVVPGITARIIRDAISNYGQFREFSKEDVERQLYDLRQQMLKKSALDDLESGKMSLKTGSERPQPSAELREIMRQVADAKKSGVFSAAARANQQKTARDAIKRALRNRIEDLNRAISTHTPVIRTKRVTEPDKEILDLRKQRDEALKLYTEVFGKPQPSAAQRQASAERTLEYLIKQAEEDIKTGNTGKKQPSGQYSPWSPSIAVKRARLEALRATKFQMEQEKNPKRTKEEVEAARYHGWMMRRIAQLEEQLAKRDYAPKGPKPERKLNKESQEARLKLEKLRQEVAIDKQRWQNERMTILQKISHVTSQLYNLTRDLQTTAELSPILRQGAWYAWTHPIKWAHAAVQSLGVATAWDSKETLMRLNDGIKQRQDYKDGLYAKIKINEPGHKLTPSEELLIGQWAEHIPLLGRIVKRTADAGNAFMNVMRADYMSLLARNGSLRDGSITKEEMNHIAASVNMFTGRGDMDMNGEFGRFMNKMLYSLPFTVSRLQVATFKPLRHGQSTSRTRKLMAKEYARAAVGGAAWIAAATIMLKALSGDEDDSISVELDPRSSDFGKIRIGRTRLDMLGGFQQSAVLLSRLARLNPSRKTTLNVPSKSGGRVGVVMPIEKADDYWEVASDFLKSKLHPNIGITASMLTGTEWYGDGKYGPRQFLGNLVPMTYPDMVDAANEHSVPVAGAASALAFFGVGLSTYGNTESEDIAKLIKAASSQPESDRGKLEKAEAVSALLEADLSRPRLAREQRDMRKRDGNKPSTEQLQRLYKALNDGRRRP